MLPLTLPMIAERAGVSVGHYTVLFKRSTGLTFSQYLRQIRIEKAKQLLRQTDLSASEIARQVGYADYFHFSRTFKRETGCSPAAFAKQSSDMNSENPTYEI
jgi:AraC-like DNA-binding protein